MKKVVLRIIVTVLILALLGVAVWLLFFPPNSNKSVFNELRSVANQPIPNFLKNKEDLKNNGFVAPIDLIKQTDKGPVKTKVAYTFEGPENFTSPNNNLIDKYKKIAYFRTYILSPTSGLSFTKNDGRNPYKNLQSTYTNNNYTQLYLENVFNNVYDVFNYYVSYSQLATGTTKAANNAVSAKISSFNSAMISFNRNVNDIIILQGQIPTVFNETVVTELYENYYAMYKSYVNVLNTFTKLTIELKDYVIKFVFNDKRVFDADSVLCDFILSTTNEMFKYELNPDDMMLNESDKTMDENGAKIDGENKNYKFLSYSFDAILMNDFTNKINRYKNSNIEDLNQFIQDYADLIAYKGENYEQTNAIVGNRNIFTLLRADKLNINETMQDYYYFENGFDGKIINVVEFAFIEL